MRTEKIKNLMVDNGDVSKAKKETFTVFDTLPCAITWLYNGTNHRIEHKDKLLPLMLKDNQHIAVIQAPYSKEFNRAYIINGDGEIIWNLKDILKEKRLLDRPLFYDVYYIKDSLYFFVVISNTDYRFEFNLYTGEIGDFIESR